jgi:integrase
LVFTNVTGGHYVHNTITHNITRIGARIGIKGLHLHDLRHTYAVSSLRAGDDVKTVQSNHGHATAAFTLDRYAHYTEDMRRESAARMEAFMKGFPEL